MSSDAEIMGRDEASLAGLVADPEFVEIDRLSWAYIEASTHELDLVSTAPGYAEAEALSAKASGALDRARLAIEQRSERTIADLVKLTHIALASAHFSPAGVLELVDCPHARAVLQAAFDLHGAMIGLPVNTENASKGGADA